MAIRAARARSGMLRDVIQPFPHYPRSTSPHSKSSVADCGGGLGRRGFQPSLLLPTEWRPEGRRGSIQTRVIARVEGRGPSESDTHAAAGRIRCAWRRACQGRAQGGRSVTGPRPPRREGRSQPPPPRRSKSRRGRSRPDGLIRPVQRPQGGARGAGPRRRSRSASRPGTRAWRRGGLRHCYDG